MAERRRNPLLSQYYSAPEPAASPKPSVPTPTDINSDSFDPDVYFQLLKERSLADLVTIDNNLRQTVKTLDNNLKTLVYENYNKFISATETIKSMKSNVNKMEADMLVLQDKMKSIETMSTNINNSMAGRRDRIDELSGVYRLLKGRQFLFDLPTRLKRDLDQGNFADAVKYFLLTIDVLKSYEHMPSFRAIQKECEAIMKELRARLWERVNDPKATIAQVAEAVGLLLDLHEDGEKLSQLYETRAKAAFNEALKADCDDVAALSKSVLPVIYSLATHYLTCLVDRAVLTSTESGRWREAVVKLTTTFVDNFNVEAQRMLAESNDVSEVIAGITAMNNSLNDSVARLPFGLSDQKIPEMISGSIRSYIERDLTTVNGEVRGAIEGALVSAANKQASEFDACTAAVDTICRAVSSFLDNLQPLVDPKWSVGRDSLTVARQVASKLLGFFTVISQFVTSLSKDENALMLSCLCIMLEKQVVPMTKEGLGALAALAQSHPTAIDPQFRASELCSLLHGAADSLLQAYAASVSSRLARIMTRSIDAGNWLSPELTIVRRPRLVVSVVVDELKLVHAAVNNLFGPKGVAAAPLETPSAATKKPSTLVNYGVSNDEMARLFNEKVRIFSHVLFSPSSVVASMLKVVIKAWIETIRLRTLNKYAMHQMQVDAYALKDAAQELVTSSECTREIDSLLAQLEASAEDRCLEPQPLEQAVLKQIVSESKVAEANNNNNNPKV